MNNRSSIRNIVARIEDMAENHNIMLSTIEKLIEVTNKDGDFPEGSIEFIRYNNQIDLINKLHSIIGGTV